MELSTHFLQVLLNSITSLCGWSSLDKVDFQFAKMMAMPPVDRVVQHLGDKNERMPYRDAEKKVIYLLLSRQSSFTECKKTTYSATLLTVNLHDL